MGKLKAARAFGNPIVFETWKKCFARHGITTISTAVNCKNSADTMLAMDAGMLVADGITEFTIMANDNDFAGLVGRLQNFGCNVVGIGEDGQLDGLFAAACDKFIPVSKIKSEPIPKLIEQRLATLLVQNSYHDASMDMGLFNELIREKMPELDIQLYGRTTLKKFLTNSSAFKIRKNNIRLSLNEPFV